MYSSQYYDPSYLEGEIQNKKISKFIGVSSFIHGAVVLVLFTLSQVVQKPIMPELITIEILDHATTPKKGITQETLIHANEPVLKESKTTKIDLKNPGLKRAQNTIKKATHRTAQKIVPKMKTVPQMKMARRAVQKSVSRPVAPIAVVPKMATLEDIQEPDVDSFGRELEAQTQMQMNDEDLQKDFEKVDQKAERNVQKTKNILTTDAQDAEQSVESSVEKLKAQNQKFQSKVGGASQRHGQAYSQIQAEAEGDINSEVEGLEGYANGLGQNIGKDSEYKGSPAYGQIDGDIRSLGDLRQKPGNVKPQYGIEDRLQRRQGQVVYVAYVQKDGRVSDFKLIKSSGYVSLDERTFNALKRWKFYPGQEGWVELPFKWDLKGGIKELPALLRANRSVSVN
ncbi:MAG TPA: energy transducer TonB [Pseudobdellovibrionaceae bacterium]|nr:energy transducer TonB [Pseudobdellovibrionaceae bacterium]